MMRLGDVYFIEYTDADGTANLLRLAGKWGLIDKGNFGSPPIEYLTQAHFQGHGEEVLNYRLTPRQIGLNVFRQAAQDRTEYWQNRQQLLDAIRPNYLAPAKLLLIRKDGSKRALDIRPDSGAPFEPLGEGSANLAISQVVQVVAHNPIWYDPTATAPSISTDVEDDLIFPITFPITFGSSGAISSTGDLAYDGTWKTYPKITLTGAYSQATIINTATNISFALIKSVASGDQRIIELDPNVGRSITNAAGNEKMSDLSDGSNLVDFAIFPASEVSGTQKINISLKGTDGSTAIAVQYYKQYYGI